MFKNTFILFWFRVFVSVCFQSTLHSYNSNLITSDFEKLVNSGLFVDKSLLISEILEREEKVFFITRPRKWGKTVNLNMLNQFLNIELDHAGNPVVTKNSVNNRLFKTNSNFINSYVSTNYAPLKITFCESALNHMGKHPVIVLNLTKIKGSSVTEIEERLQQTVTGLFCSYPFLPQYLKNESDLLDSDEKLRLHHFLNGQYDEEYFFDSLAFLSMLLYEHFHSLVCILVDDYDFPIINALLAFGNRGAELNYLIEMFRRFYEYTFKENYYIFKAIISGTLSFDVVPSGDPDLKYQYLSYNSVLNKSLSQFYGFSINEINNILLNTKMISHVRASDIRKWYGGIQLNSIENLNPSSVMQYILSNGKLDYYLQHENESDFSNLFYQTFLCDSLFEELLLLAEGKTITATGINYFMPLMPHDFYTMLVHSGYLISIPPSGRFTGQPIWRVKIPNEEIKGIFANGFKIWFCNRLNTSLTEYTDLKNSIIAKEGNKFGQKLQNMLFGTNKHKFNTDETHYHNLMAGFTASLMMEYSVGYIRELGQCRGECVMMPRDINVITAINMEYTVCKPGQKIEDIVKSSLSDLVNRPFMCSKKLRIESHIKQIFYVAVGFCGSNMDVLSKLSCI